MHLRMPSPPLSAAVDVEAAGGQTTPTDPRSQRIRASRRGGQLLTRAQSPSNKNGLPDLRLLPDAPVPDGRTVLTNPDARGAEAVMGHGRHLRRFILDTNPIESSFATVKLRTKVTKGAGSSKAALAMAYKLLDAAQERWRRFNGHELVADVLAGVKFKDGERVTDDEANKDHMTDERVAA